MRQNRLKWWDLHHTGGLRLFAALIHQIQRFTLAPTRYLCHQPQVLSMHLERIATLLMKRLALQLWWILTIGGHLRVFTDNVETTAANKIFNSVGGNSNFDAETSGVVDTLIRLRRRRARKSADLQIWSRRNR